MSKVALITGTSTGIGLATAVVFARSGFQVVATMRDVGKATALRERAAKEGAALVVEQLDVVDQASIDACVAKVKAEHGSIDVLVNNAGTGYLGTLEQTSFAAMQRTIDTNFFSVWRLTQAVLPAMREARSGRIISVTSVGGVIGQPFNEAYCAAKFAVEGMMESLAPVVKALGVHVSLIEPGPVKTEFVANVWAIREPTPGGSLDVYDAMLKQYLAGTEARFASIGQTGDDVAQVILNAATAEAPHFRYSTSDTMRGLIKSKLVDPTGDAAIATYAAAVAASK
jgi:NAD(P)-dependent dehydrogenase (short-subunit alcohol dehydrogenase family)